MQRSRFEICRVSGMPVSDGDLLADLRNTADLIGKKTVTEKEYRQHGKFDDTTLRRRFGSWNHALNAAGLTLSNEVEISDERLFDNLLVLWQHFGRQPRRSELAVAPSRISQSPYNRRFGSWSNALAAFVQYANASDADASGDQKDLARKPATGRDPSLRLRWHVLQRDRFKCCACGASPAITPGVELHVDHIVPWSKGGETTIANLQTLCSSCNLGKSNLAPSHEQSQ
ncbi:arsenate reductase [Burkholderiales bacterium GJ-E10]|nr:arsenate reductase [Burkholderiales bacterium GJ-E10]